MAFVPPAPGLVSGRAENREEVLLRIARVPVLDGPKDELQASNRFRSCESRCAEAGLEQRERRFTLGGIHLGKWKPLARPRNVMPVEPLFGVEWELDFGFLCIVQRGQERRGGSGH